MASPNPLQRYQIMEPLAAGGQGQIFRGVDRDTSREVAIKVISIKGLSHWKAFDLFEREIAVLKTLKHPAIPEYIDSYSSENTGDFFLVMELIEGKPLSESLGRDNHQLALATLQTVFNEMLDVLEYLHARRPPVIHRDIKPANIVLRDNGRVALVDFGGTRLLDGAQRHSTMIGTVGYMAPEQVQGQANPSTDLYSLGATLAALLGGREADELPHDGLRIDLSSLTVPPRLRPVLEWMLEPEPSLRPPSVAAVRKRLARPSASSKRQRAAPKAEARDDPRRDPGRDPGQGQPPPTQAMTKVPEGALALASVGPPLSILVWVVTALASGGILLFESVLLPLAYRLVSAILGQPRNPGEAIRRENFERNFSEFKRRVQYNRTTLGYVAEHTRPKTER